VKTRLSQFRDLAVEEKNGKISISLKKRCGNLEDKIIYLAKISQGIKYMTRLL
jgi:ribosomal protein S2